MSDWSPSTPRPADPGMPSDRGIHPVALLIVGVALIVFCVFCGFTAFHRTAAATVTVTRTPIVEIRHGLKTWCDRPGIRVYESSTHSIAVIAQMTDGFDVGCP